MRKIKKLKIKQNSSNDYSNYHYFIPNSENIKCADGSSVDDKIASLRTEIDTLEPKTEYLMKKAPLIDMAEGSSLTLPGTADAALRKYKILGDSYQEVIAAEEGTTVEGEYITVNDYNVNKEETLSIGGNSYQATRSGKNKFNINDYEILTGGTLGFSIKDLEIGKQYTIKSKNPISSFKISNYTGGYSSVAFNNASENTFVMSSNSNIPVTETQYIFLKIDIDGTGTWVTDISQLEGFDIQIEEGPTATAYEPYGVSPSPDYPSEVKNVGSNVNLFDINSTTPTWCTIANGVVTTSALNNYGWFMLQLDNTFTVKNNVCISYDLRIVSGTMTKVHNYCVLNNSKTNQIIIPYINAPIPTSSFKRYVAVIALDTDLEISNFFVQIAGGVDAVLEIKNIKIEENTINTSYSSYLSGSTKPIYVSKNLANPNFAQDLLDRLGIAPSNTNNCITTDGERRVFKFSSSLGYQTGENYLFRNIFKENTQYVFSCYLKANGENNFTNIAVYYTDGAVQEVRASTSAEYVYYEIKTQSNKTIKEISTIWKSSNTYIDLDTVMLNEGTIALPYEPYQCTSYTIPLEHEYCALPNGVRDTIEKVKGVWNRVQRVGTWWFDGVNPGHRMIGHNGIVGEYPSFYVDKSVMGEYETGERLTLCSHFIGNLWNNVNATACNAWWSATTSCGFRIHKSFLSNYSEATTDTEKIAAANNWLAEQYAAGTPVTVYYELATPVYTVLDDNMQEILNGAQNFNVNSTTLNVYSLNEISPHNTLHYNYVTPAPSPERPSEVRNVGDNKNLFDKNNGDIVNDLFINASEKDISTSGYTKLIRIPINSNTTYTVSKRQSRRFSIATSIVKPVLHTKLTNVNEYHSATQLTITSGPKDTYLCIYYHHETYDSDSNITEQEILDTIKVEKGSKATNYTPYNYGDIELNTNAKNLFNEEGYINVDIKTNKRYELNLTDLTQTYLTISYSTYMVAPASDGSTKAQHFFAFYDKEGLTIKSGHFNVFNYEDTITHYEKQSIITIPDNAVKMMIDISPYVSSSKSPTIRYDWIQLEYGKYATEYIPYESNNYIFQTPDECCSLPNGVQDSIEKIDGVWNRVQRVQHISRAVADMNNSESYPGWTNITELLDDFAGHNTSLSNVATYIHNIGNNYSGDIGVNGGGSGILFLTAGVWGMTQTEWKTYYSNLIFNLYYEKPEPVYTPITDQNLINTLNQLEQDGTYYGDTNIYFEPTSENVSAQIKMIYKKDINALIADSGV